MDTKTNPIPPSELIINSDGSIFHLHLKPEQLADRIVLVGDPDRVTMIGKYLSDIECDVCNREFHSITGRYAGKRLTILSHGIGGDNIDIVVNELDALANIDFSTRLPRETPPHADHGAYRHLRRSSTLVSHRHLRGRRACRRF